MRGGPAMDLIGVIIALFVGFIIIGIVCALAENRKDRSEDEPPRVVISQQVPSVFDTFKKKK